MSKQYYDLEKYKFINFLAGGVNADRQDIGTALYARQDHGIMIVTNISDNQIDDITVRIAKHLAASYNLPEQCFIQSLRPWEIRFLDLEGVTKP